MNYLNTTQLRTKVPLLIKMLIAGKRAKLFHRSKLISQVIPLKPERVKVFKAQDLLEKTQGLKLKKYSPEEIKIKYRTILKTKHG